MTDQRDERAREGGGDVSERRPPDGERELNRERDFGRTDRDATVDSGEAYARREVPGGDRPARTPGATGPTTRDIAAAHEGLGGEGAVPQESDANEQLVGRARLGDGMKRSPAPNKSTE